MCGLGPHKKGAAWPDSRVGRGTQRRAGACGVFRGLQLSRVLIPHNSLLLLTRSGDGPCGSGGMVYVCVNERERGAPRRARGVVRARRKSESRPSPWPLSTPTFFPPSHPAPLPFSPYHEDGRRLPAAPARRQRLPVRRGRDQGPQVR